MSKSTEQLLEDIRRYQRSDFVHPLTCIDSTHDVLVPFVEEDMVKLLCPDCGEITYPPKFDFRGLLRHVTEAFNPR